MNRQKRRNVRALALILAGFMLLVFVITLNNTHLPWQCLPSFAKACVKDAYLTRMAFEITNEAARAAAEVIP